MKLVEIMWLLLGATEFLQFCWSDTEKYLFSLFISKDGWERDYWQQWLNALHFNHLCFVLCYIPCKLLSPAILMLLLFTFMFTFIPCSLILICEYPFINTGWTGVIPGSLFCVRSSTVLGNNMVARSYFRLPVIAKCDFAKCRALLY